MSALTSKIEKPIAEVLNNVETELSQLGKLLERLQLTVSPLLIASDCKMKSQIDMQSLDLATQQVKALATVIGSLASIAGPDWLVVPNRLVATLTLQALADRICGQVVTEGRESHGGCELL